MTDSNDRSREMTEQARWFLLSVLQHLRDEVWQSPDSSGLSEAEQYRLAAALLENNQARQSLQVVLRDNRYRNTLVRFGQQRRAEVLMLSDSTLAYAYARDLLNGCDDSEPENEIETESDHNQKATNRSAGRQAESVVETVVSRRAARRQIPEHEMAYSRERADRKNPASDKSGQYLSEHEYAELEQAMARPAQSLEEPKSLSKRQQEWLSRLAGLAVGTVLFLLVSLLFF